MRSLSLGRRIAADCALIALLACAGFGAVVHVENEPAITAGTAATLARAEAGFAAAPAETLAAARGVGEDAAEVRRQGEGLRDELGRLIARLRAG